MSRLTSELRFATRCISASTKVKFWKSFLRVKDDKNCLLPRIASKLFKRLPITPMNRRHLTDDYERRFVEYSLSHWRDSHSQMYQDLLALYVHDFKRGGYFVEFGATNGVTLSNTLLLESSFGWTGILAEPAKMWHEDLIKNRRAVIDTRCVWKTSGETLNFSESAELSAVTGGGRGISLSPEYTVTTITLNELLSANHAPQNIDFVSIDTEGSELEILSAFDFSKWNVSLFVIEHNYDVLKRDGLFNLLSSHGYRRIFSDLSLFDDWYIKNK